ncbi:unnamed protein product, partial [Pelagomonas calceolata]
LNQLLVAHRDGLRAQRVVRRDADRLERRRVIIKFLAAEGEVLLLGLDNLGIWHGLLDLGLELEDRVTQCDLHLVHGPARVFVGK